MAPPRKGAFSKTELRTAIDRLKNAVHGKSLAALAETLKVNPNLLYSWRKTGKKEINVSPVVEDAIKLGRLEMRLGLSSDEIVPICKRWLKLSARQDISEEQIGIIIKDLEATEQVDELCTQFVRFHRERKSIVGLLKTLSVLEGELTISDLLFILKSEEELGVQMNSSLAKELLAAQANH